MSDAQNTGTHASEPRPTRLRDALRQARIEAADRTGVVVELRDAEVARLEILNEALDPLFAQVPEQVDLFDRGISQGETPRLWIDVVAHVVMGRDKRIYRFVQDTRFGRIVLAESHDVPRDRRCRHRLCRAPHDRARARDGGDAMSRAGGREKPRRGGFGTFVFGFLLGAPPCSASPCWRPCGAGETLASSLRAQRSNPGSSAESSGLLRRRNDGELDQPCLLDLPI